jgi:CheY-like chemotaxis protein/DNA-binding MarR family transcriptional regulator
VAFIWIKSAMKVPKRILVVDDDPAARAYVEEILSDVGFVCVSAGSGAEALRVIEADGDIAVVVSDLVMPGLDGVRLGRFIRERFPERSWLQVLFVTGHSELELAVSALRLGAVDYLTKPVDPDVLVTAVARALAASRAILRSLPQPAAVADDEAPTGNGGNPSSTPNADHIARSALDYLSELRRMRRESGVLAPLDEPSWTILLEVYRAEITGRRLSVSKLCALDEASQTTAWRRIRSMEDDGLLLREQDPVDARRSFVSLTEPSSRAVADFMSRADGLMSGRPA